MKIHKERPILFSGPMVRAIREGRKTQTRRIIKPQPSETHWDTIPGYKLLVGGPHNLSCGRLGWRFQHCIPQNPLGDKPTWAVCPYGKPGDRLWVRETWGLMCHHDTTDWMSESIVSIPESELREQYLVEHAANWNLPSESAYWRPSIHMPRWASRITLEIVSVRVERLQDISDEDAKAEGADFGFWHPQQGVFSEPTDEEDEQNSCFRDGFGFLWESINGPGSWDLNPWVWVVEFKEVK